MPTLTSITVHEGAGDTIKVLPMTDHYAVTASGEVVAVVCRVNELQWGIEVIVGKVDGVTRYIPLDAALKTAMTWHR
jgi:hypothetical protein